MSQVTTGATTTSFTYDGLGSRLVKTTTGGVTSVYPFGDDYEITDGVVTKYITVQGLGVIAKRVGYGPGATTYWLHNDRLGSVQAVTLADGSVEFRRTYRPYGETLGEGGSHAGSRGWIDQRLATETGLTYLHARYYSPQLGIFVSPDRLHPSRPGVGVNRYAYALGNPVNATDRSGTDCWEWYQRAIKETGFSFAGGGGDCSWAQGQMNAPETPTDFSDPAGPGGTTPPMGQPGDRRPEHPRDSGDSDEDTGNNGNGDETDEDKEGVKVSGNLIDGTGGKITVVVGEFGFGVCFEVGAGASAGASLEPATELPQTGLVYSAEASGSSSSTGGGGVEITHTRDILGSGEDKLTETVFVQTPLVGFRENYDLQTGETHYSGSISGKVGLHVAAGVCLSIER